jgi:hypothetical protein
MPIPWYSTDSERFFHELLKYSMKESEISIIKGESSADFVYMTLQKSEHPYIIVSHGDLIVKPGIFKNLKSHIDTSVSMAFIQEDGQLSSSFMLLKVCPEVIEFWRTLKEIHINNAIKGYTGKWLLLDNQIFTTSDTWNMAKPYSLMKLKTSGLGTQMDFAEKIFNAAQNLDIEPFMKYVPEEIIPFIYKFQEILYLSHQEAKSAGIS